MKKVLLVDDDLDIIEIYSELLEEMGYQVLSARDGQEALALAQAQPPALLITDVAMPRMNGLELCQRLRADERLRAIPILIHTGEKDFVPPSGVKALSKSGELSAFKAAVSRVLRASKQEEPGSRDWQARALSR